MDAFARSLIIADKIFQQSPYKKYAKIAMRHSTVEKEKNLKKGTELEDLRTFVMSNGEPNKQAANRNGWRISSTNISKPAD